MDLRTLPDGLTPEERCDTRRQRIEKELDLDLSDVAVKKGTVGTADEKNCEQMFGQVPIPVGYAGPLTVNFSDETTASVHLPLATTEGALVASVNRGCKAISMSGGAKTTSVHHGTSRSLAFEVGRAGQLFQRELELRKAEWKEIAEQTSSHLKVIHHSIELAGKFAYLTIACDTDEAMGMNMITIAANAVGEWVEKNMKEYRPTFVTVAGNVDSDKKASLRTYEKGRGFEVFAEVTLSEETITDVLKSSIDAMVEVGEAKLEVGSEVAGAIGANLHAANIIAALYLATGQDAAHVVEGSMADTSLEKEKEGLKITVRLPAVMVGIRGGGTGLPAQSQLLAMLLKEKTSLHPRKQLAESIAAAVLAGEISLLAAQASHHLAKAHKTLGR